MNQNQMTPKDKKNAHILCYISLGLYLVPVLCNILFYFLYFMETEMRTQELLESSQTARMSDLVLTILTPISGICFIAAIVLMIVARVKYPASIFAKVLMWVYITLFVISMVIFAIVMITCAIACDNCMDELSNCPGFIRLLGLQKW